MSTATLAELPALPLHTAGKYVAGAYIVLFALVLIYVVVLAIRLGRMERRLGELLDEPEGAQPAEEQPAEELTRAESTLA